MNPQILVRSVAIGIFATMMMDLVAVVGFKAGLAGRGPRRQGLEFIGRWIGYLLRGKVRHEDILLTPPLPGERSLGLITHYMTGIALGFAYIGLLKAAATIPSLWSGLAFGTFTVVLPWFLYFPAIGAGIMGRVGSPRLDMARTSLLTHAVYGLGLTIGARTFL